MAYRSLKSSRGVRRPPSLAAVGGGGGGGGGGGTFTPIANPLIAGLGASRIRQAGSGQSSVAYALTGGTLTWLKFIDDRIKFTNWYDTVDPNSFSQNGMLFAEDGQDFSQMYNRLPKLLSSDANIVFMDMASGSFQFDVEDLFNNVIGPISVSNYNGVAKQLVGIIRAARPDMLVVVSSLVERNSGSGGPWALGFPRTLVPAINADMAAWCATQTGVVFADLRSVLIDTSTSANEPLPGMTRDGTHWSPRGAYLTAQVLKAAIDPYISATARGTFATGANLLPAFAGTGGTITGTGLSGQVPTGYTLTRQGSTSNATVAASVVNQGGKNWLRLLIDTTAMADTDIEGVTLQPSAAAATVVNQWYVGSVLVDAKAHDAWILTGQMSIPGASGLTGVNNGLTPITSTFITNTPMFMPASAFAGRVETFSGKASATTATPSIRVVLKKGSGGVREILIAEPELTTVSDPNLIMYNEADTTPIAFTSSLAPSYPEGAIYSHQLVTNKPYAKFALSGPDAAAFTVSKWGVLKPLAAPDFEIPSDANTDNVFDVTVTATSFNTGAGSVASQHLISISDVNDGFSDAFNRADEALDASPNWTPVSPVGTGSLVVSGNRLRAITGTETIYLAPQQGATAQQRVSWSLFTSAIGSSPRIYLIYVDTNNKVYLRQTANSMNIDLVVFIGGVSTVYPVPMYQALAINTRIMAQYLGDAIEVYQNDVLRLRQVIGANAFGVGAVARSGASNANNISSSVTFADTFNNRVAADYSASAKIALAALTLSATTGTAGVEFTATVNGKTQGSTVVLTINSGPAGGTWILDGPILRGTDLVAGTYTFTITETHPNAANSGRTSSVSVVVS